jgi:hypothetical protein
MFVFLMFLFLLERGRVSLPVRRERMARGNRLAEPRGGSSVNGLAIVGAATGAVTRR